jgi:DNA polymerase-3 subunit alpha
MILPASASDTSAPAEANKIHRPFAHLHCHSHYSLLDGANRIPKVVEKVKKSGMNSIAITDHGNLYGALEFYSTCKGSDVKPILGYEAYIAPGRRTDRSAMKMRDASFHLTLLAMNRTGFQNLMKLSSKAFLEGFYYRPRIDKEILEEFSEGLICLTGCASSELSRLLLADKTEEAEKLAAWYKKVFDDRVYFEIQNSGIPIQQQCLERTVDLANRMGLPLVATNDAHYLNSEDARTHDVLLCVNTGAVESNDGSGKGRMKMETNQLHLRTPDEMYTAFPGLEEAVSRSQEIADRVDIDLDLKTRHYPVFAPPDQMTDKEYLRHLCDKGMKWRYGDNPADVYKLRLESELGVIEKMGYASYFLIVWDFARFARENKIPCTARGSACGAIVAYLLGISDVCPIKYDLLFERFLDPSRTEAPDIDIDFCRDRRQMVIDYVKQKYGEENVAQIGTFGTLKAKAAIRDVGRALAVPLKNVDEIAKLVPETLNISISDALKESPELKAKYDSEPQIKELLDFAINLEGLAKSAGTHAAGVVIADTRLDAYVPLQKITGKDDILTQWTEVEKAGLLKMDFLGLRNLTILDKAVKNVKKHHGIDIVPIDLPLDDKETFELLQRGETKGIFQLESGGMRDLLTKMKPDKFEDIIATSALYRPGPLEGGMVMTYVRVKHKEEPIPQVHPVVDGVLNETYGVMVYQEQVMRILNRMGGIELSAAYRCIKAISKKKAETINKFKEEFLDGSVKKDMSLENAENLWNLIEKFAGYGFNKSHSTAYGAIAYQTAYLKAHYPHEFMAALLSCGMESSERITEHVEDCLRQKIEVLPPNVNQSDVEFSVVGEAITFGMGAIKGLGEQAVQAIVDEREANGLFKNIYDLAERVDPKCLSKGNLEILIKAGALDCFKVNRASHLAVVERAINGAASKHRDKLRGQRSLFGDDDDTTQENGQTESALVPEIPEFPDSQKLAYEKEVIGFYLSSHPLAQYADKLGSISTHQIRELRELEQQTPIFIGGIISSVHKAMTKSPSKNGNSRYANFDLEDTTGVVRCIIWPDTFAGYTDLITTENVVLIKGVVDRRGREPNVIVDQVFLLDDAEYEFAQRLAIKFRKGLHGEGELRDVRRLLSDYEGGRTEVVFIVEMSPDDNPDNKYRCILGPKDGLKVNCDPNLRKELEAVIGRDNYRLHLPKKTRSFR